MSLQLPLPKPLNAALLTAAALSFLSIAPVALAGPGQPGHSHSHGEYSAGQPGDPKKPARIVPVTMRETDDGKMVYIPNRVDVKRGEQVRFIVTNAGAIPLPRERRIALHERLKHPRQSDRIDADAAIDRFEHEGILALSAHPQHDAAVRGELRRIGRNR